MLVLLNVEDILADLGCTSVTAAATVDQALDLIDANVFDAAMVDVNLDGRKSYPVADALAARGVPFVFATGYDETTIPARYAAVTRCEKPVDPQAIAKALFP